MSRFRCLTLGFTLAVVLGTGQPASADPVTITSGVLAIGGVQDINSRGFLRSVGFDFSTDAFRLRWADADWSRQNPLFPTLTRVADYTPFGGATETVFLEHATFAVTATPSTSPSPFFLSGRLMLVSMATGATLFDATVTGSGMATWMFVAGSNVSGVRYEFSDEAPVPEPATLLLLGTGLVGLAVRRNRLRTSRATPDVRPGE